MNYVISSVSRHLDVACVVLCEDGDASSKAMLMPHCYSHVVIYSTCCCLF